MSHDKPAFPVDEYYSFNGEPHLAEQHFGMTLRDYFAAKAMQADVARVGHYGTPEHQLWAAKNAYKMADAMLKAREVSDAE